MHSFLKQSTASQTRTLGPFLDDTDFKTAETGLTIANTDIKLMANGGTSANKNSGGGTHLVNGFYAVTFDATDTATVGELTISVVVAGAAPIFTKFTVLEEVVYDAFYAASAPGYLQPTVAGRTLDVSATGEAGIDWANIGAPTTAQTLSGTTVGTATDVTTVNGLAANVITAAATATDFTTEVTSGLATASSITTLAGYVDTEVASILAAVDTEVAAIKAVTDALPNAGALTSLATQASVNTIDDFLDTEVAAILAAVDTEVAAIKTKTDQLIFTKTNELDVNVQSMNGATVVGDGNATPWGGA